MLLENNLTFLFTQITNTFKDMLDKNLKEIGLHGGQAFVLASLWHEDAQTQIKLAQTLGLSPPTINKMVKSLADNGFVSCQKCESDGRSVRVYITEKGVECRSAVEAQWEKTESTFFVNLTVTEKLIFVQVLENLKRTPV